MSRPRLALVAGLAWRLARGHRRRLLLVVLLVAIGVAARVCVAALAEETARSVAHEARGLLGADLEVAGNQPLDAERLALVMRLMPPGSRTAREETLLTMARSDAPMHLHLVELHGISQEHPLGGRTVLADAHGRELPLDCLWQGGPGVAMPRTALDELGLALGDHVHLGGLVLPVRAELSEDPGMGSNPFVAGPRVLVPAEALAGSSLVGAGARVRYQLLVACPDTRQGQRLAEALRSAWHMERRLNAGFPGRIDSETGIQVRSASESQESLSRFFILLGDFLGLAGLASLLRGGVGVAGVMRAAVAGRLESAAVLQVLGAPPTSVQLLFAIQALALGALGGLVGALIGSLAENLVVWLLRTLLPVVVPFSLHPLVMAEGVALGALTAGFFAWLPILELGSLRPLAILRGDGAPAASRLAVLLLLASGFAVFALVAGMDAHSYSVGAILVGGLGLGAVLLRGLAALALPLLGRIRFGPVGLRMALGNLGRPGFRAGDAVMAIGMSALLLSSTACRESSIAQEFSAGSQLGRPSLFCIDIQVDQREDFRDTVHNAIGAEPRLAPMIIARLRAVVRPHLAGTAAPAAGDPVLPARFRDHEVRLSFRSELSQDERILPGGRWLADDAQHPEISLEEHFAGSLGVHLHDRLRLQVQGPTIEAEVTSLRRVDWLGLRPNFIILVSPSAIRDAPQTWIASIPALPQASRSRLIGIINGRFPTITVLDVADLANRIGSFVDSIGVAVRVVSLTTLLAGLVVLLGIAIATARERQQDAALLQVLGARPGQLLLMLGIEFGLLGGIGAVAGLAGGVALAWMQPGSLIDLPLVIPTLDLVLLAAACVALSAAAGLIACRRAVTAPPLETLREAWGPSGTSTARPYLGGRIRSGTGGGGRATCPGRGRSGRRRSNDGCSWTPHCCRWRWAGGGRRAGPRSR